jgi:hypothetical protein
VIEEPGFTILPTFEFAPGQTVSAQTLADPDLFYLEALEIDSVETQLRSLIYFGVPTPDTTWQTSTQGEAELRLYQLSGDLFSIIEAPAANGQPGGLPFGQPNPLPASEATRFVDDSFGQLLMLSGTGQPLVSGNGPQGPSKWALGWFAVDGSGAEQTTALGVMAADVLPTLAGHPASGGSLAVFTRTSPTGPGSVGAIPLGTLDDGAGVTSYGPVGDYFVLGAADPLAADEGGGFTGRAATYRTIEDGALQTARYETTRFAALVDQTGVPDGGRVRLGQPAGETAFAETAPADSHLLTGGFAVATGDRFVVQDDAVLWSHPMVVKTGDADGVVMAFSPATNSVSAAFSGLTVEAGETSLTGGRLNWGGTGGASVFVNDETVFLREAADPVAGGITGAPAGVDQASAEAFTSAHGSVTGSTLSGVMASVNAVGTGGAGDVFEPGIDTTPEHLRWGWWAGEATVTTDMGEGNAEAHHYLAPLGSWVAGVRADIADVQAATGSAVYDGFAVGHVVEQTGAGAAAYVDGGRVRLDYNFGTDTGRATISDIIGATVSAPVGIESAVGANHYGGAIDTGGTGRIDGAFFNGQGHVRGDQPAATAGQFGFEATTPGGNPARVVGTFGADRQ